MTASAAEKYSQLPARRMKRKSWSRSTDVSRFDRL